MQPEQERLIVPTRVGSGDDDLAIVDFDSPIGSVGLSERSIRLRSTLKCLSEKKDKENDRKSLLVRSGHMSEDERLGRLENTESEISAKTLEMKTEFAHACGMYALIEAGLDPVDAKDYARTCFSEFLIEVGPSSLRNSKKIQDELKRAYEYTADTNPLELEVPQHGTFQEAGNIKTKEQAGPRSAIEAILGDPRSGFYVYSLAEKNRILPWLDYLDEPVEYPRVIWHQLEEIFIHQMNHGHGVSGGYDAVRSVVYETIDFFDNAKNALSILRRASEEIEELAHYRYRMEQEFGESHPIYPILARFSALQGCIRDGQPIGEALLSAYVSRFDKPMQGKNKTIQDRWTADHKDKKVSEGISFVKELKVVEAKRLIDQAKINEDKREIFYRDRLSDIVRFAPQGRIFEQVVDIARNARDN